ncbi:MAG: sigma 54-interacting transcriptional regulator [Acidobacteriota bacterium]
MQKRAEFSTETDLRSGLGGAPAPSSYVPGLTLLAHPDLDRVGERAALPTLAAGGTVRLSRREPLFHEPGRGHERPLDHRGLSRRPVLLHGRDDGGVELELGSSRTPVLLGGGGRRLEGRKVFGATDLDRGVILRLGRQVLLLLHRLDCVDTLLPRGELIGESPEMLRLRANISKVADLETPVLIRGETGSGKELTARALHDASRRRRGPFVAVNMAALPPGLAAAELFGAARGAFTGADRRRDGLFARADGGTLFLDEIGEATLAVQAMLLRVLETGEVRPVGEDRGRQVSVRIVSATDARLEEDIAESRFRAPLLHRLAGYELELPPLRSRREDVGRLLRHFLRQELAAVGEEWRVGEAGAREPWMSAEIVARLASFDWPGNVRQLRNVIRQIVISSRGDSVAHLPASIATLLATAATAETPAAATAGAGAPGGGRAGDGRTKPSEIGEGQLIELLRRHRFNIRAAAAAAGISPTSLYKLVENSPRLRKPSQIDAPELLACLDASGGDLGAAAAQLEVSVPGLKRRLKALGLR